MLVLKDTLKLDRAAMQAADLTDRDNDGIPDLVEEMYSPLVVTAEEH